MNDCVPRPHCVPTASQDAVPPPRTTASRVPLPRGDADAVAVAGRIRRTHDLDCVPGSVAS